MTNADRKELAGKIDGLFSTLTGLRDHGKYAVKYGGEKEGRMFELRSLLWLVRILRTSGYIVRFANGPEFPFSAPRHFDPKLPHFKVFPTEQNVTKSSVVAGSVNHVAEIWTNMEVTGQGHASIVPRRAPINPDYHELDIAVTLPIGGAPKFINSKQILIAVECKDRELSKNFLREVLGLRRELSSRRDPETQAFQIQLAGYSAVTRQSPPSRVFLLTSEPIPADYDKIAPDHCIHVLHLKLEFK